MSWLIKSKAASQVIDSSGNLVEKVGAAFDLNFTSKQEKLEARNEVVKIPAGLISQLNELRSKVVLAESYGSRLQRSWRPLLMLSFGFIIVSAWFFFPLLNLVIKDNQFAYFIMMLKDADKFWSVVELAGKIKVKRSTHLFNKIS